jgi:hypothetical protein
MGFARSKHSVVVREKKSGVIGIEFVVIDDDKVVEETSETTSNPTSSPPRDEVAVLDENNVITVTLDDNEEDDWGDRCLIIDEDEESGTSIEDSDKKTEILRNSDPIIDFIDLAEEDGSEFMNEEEEEEEDDDEDEPLPILETSEQGDEVVNTGE